MTKQSDTVLRRFIRRVLRLRSQLTGEQVTQPMIDREGIGWAYRLFLDRDPENQSVVEEKARRLTTTKAVRLEFMNSEEFVLKSHSSLVGNEPRMQIEDVQSEDDLRRLFEHIQEIPGSA